MNKNLIKAYETDASGIEGRARDVLFPKTISEVRQIASRESRLVIRGGGSGLAGGAVPQNRLDVVLDLMKLHSIEGFDSERKTIIVEAGVILDDLQNYLAKFGLEFPVNPGSHAIASIGGMLATNAVGMRAMKYGSSSNWVKWVEVVDCNGHLERKGVTEMSDYIGMEGISGVIVRACLKLSPLRERTASLITVENYSEIVSIVRTLKRDSNISMVEFIDSFVSEGIGLERKMHLIVEYENGKGILNGEEYYNLIRMRDKIYPFLAGEGYVRIEDPKIMIDRFEKLMFWLEKNNIPVFGHISVGIIHPCFSKSQEKLIPEMIKLVKRLGGQVSGEHGIGLLKKKFVESNDKKILINIKKRTDPLNKFNVGKVL